MSIFSTANKKVFLLFNILCISCASSIAFAHSVLPPIGDSTYDISPISTLPINGGGSGADIIGVSGWANTGALGVLESGVIRSWGVGTGLVNADESNGAPQYAVDNDGAYDSLLFQFSADIILTEIDIGWRRTDSDISVLAYVGSGLPASLAGQKYGELTNNDWAFVGHYEDVYSNQNRRAAINSLNIASSFWLIGAYNPLLGSSQATSGDDYVKISALHGMAPPASVPEPSVIFLLIVGLFVIMWRKLPRGRDSNFAAMS